jgi:hypothetical protein
MESGDINFTNNLRLKSNGGNLVLDSSGTSTSLYGSTIDIRDGSNIFIRVDDNLSGGIKFSSAQVKVLGDSSPSASLSVDGDIAGNGALALEVKSTITSQSVDIQGGTRFSGSLRALGGQIQLGDTGSGNSIDIPENGTAVVKGSTDFFNGAIYFGDQVNVGGTFNTSGGGSTFNLQDGTSVNINADMNLSASKQLIGTASYAMFAETTSGTITNAATASYVNPLTQSVELLGNLNVNGTADVTGLTAGASGVNIGTPTTSPVQFPIFKANGDSGLGSIYGGFQISDDGSTANSSMAVSTFTGLDGSNPVFEISGPGTNRMFWSSANFPYFHIPQLLKAQSGAHVTGSASISGSLLIDGEAPNLDINTSVKGGTPNLRLYQAYNGSDVKFANISINDSTGTYTSPSLFGRFSNAVSAFGNSAGSPFTVIAGGAAGGAFNHWGLVLDQTGDIKSLKEMNMYSGAKVSGSLIVTGSTDINGVLSLPGIANVSASIAAGGVAAFPFTGSAGITGSLDVVGNTQITGSLNIKGDGSNAITANGSSVSANINIGSNSSGQKPRIGTFKVNLDSGVNGTSAGVLNFRNINSGSTDTSTNFALSDFTGLDSGPVLTLTHDTGIVRTLFWSSENYPYLNLPTQVNITAPVSASAVISASGGIIGDLTGTATSASYALTASFVEGIIDSASFAATASYVNPLVQDLQITGSVDITGSLSLNGTPITGGGGSAFPFVGDAAITGSLNISGSITGNIATPPLTSSGGTGFDFTASLDFNQASFFNIALDNGSTYHFKPYNMQPGQTVTLKVPQAPDGNGVVAWSPEFKFPGGNIPAATQGTGAEDIYTFVTFDTGSVYTVQTPGLA